jgi:uncharacterized protein
VTVEVDVRDLVDRPGSHRTVHVQEPIEGLRTELAQVPVDRPVEAELLMESVVEGVLASGPVTGTMRLSCARCLDPFDATFEVEVQELFVREAGPGEDEYPLHEGIVDVEPMIRDVVVTAMPFAPLCRPECLGLCPRCGSNLNVGTCTCPPETDVRWSVLSGIQFDVEPAQTKEREE